MKLKIADRFINSFFPHDSLNPSIYNEGGKMKPAVHQAIMLVIEEFLDTIEYDLSISDIESVLLTGSLANYNYNKWSDADLHLLVDYSKFDEDKKFVRDYLRSKAINWNDRHKVTIYGHEIEIYFQDVNEPHHSTGIYDVAKDRWSVEPKKIDNKDVIDENLPLAFNKADYISIEIDKLASRQNDTTIEKIDILKDKIKKMRQSGLERDGEYSIENIAFKILRRRGDLKLLHQAARIIADKNLSIPKILDEDQEWWKKRRSLDNKNYRELLGYSGKKSTFKRKYASKKTGYPKSANRRKIAKSGKPYMHNPRLKLGISAPPGVMQEREIAPTEEAEKGTFSILRALSNNVKTRDRVISNIMKNTNQKFLMLRKERRFATEKCLKGHSYEFVRSPGGWQMRLVDDINKIKHPDNILIDPKECLYNQGRPMDLDETGLINILDDELETSRAVEIKTDNGLSYHVPGFSTVVAKAAAPTKIEPEKERAVAKTKLGNYLMKIKDGMFVFEMKTNEWFVGVPPIVFLAGRKYAARIGEENVIVRSENPLLKAAVEAFKLATDEFRPKAEDNVAEKLQKRAMRAAARRAFEGIKKRAGKSMKPVDTTLSKRAFVAKLNSLGPPCKVIECDKSSVARLRQVGEKMERYGRKTVTEIMAGAGMAGVGMPPAVIAPAPKPEVPAGQIKYSVEGETYGLDVSLKTSLKSLAKFAAKKKNANKSVKINVYSGMNTRGGHATGQHPEGLAVDFKIEVDGQELKDEETYGLTLAAMALGVMDSDAGIGYYMGAYNPTSGMSTNRGIHYDQGANRGIPGSSAPGRGAWFWFACGGDPAVSDEFNRPKKVKKCNDHEFNGHPKGLSIKKAKSPSTKFRTFSSRTQHDIILTNPLALPQDVISYARMYYTPESTTA